MMQWYLHCKHYMDNFMTWHLGEMFYDPRDFALKRL